jgi:hypothetical protein
MTKGEQTGAILVLVTIIALLFLWLLKKKQTPAPQTTTQTSVTLQGTTTTFPARNDNNEVTLRVCTYDSGAQLTLDPRATNGSICPPVFIDITGKQGNLVKDALIVVPQSGQTSFTTTPAATPTPAGDMAEAI